MAGDFLAIEVNEESFPWIKGRKKDSASPKHKIISRSRTKGGISVVMLHTAGTGYVKNYYMKELLYDEEMLAGMAPKEIELLRWVIESENRNQMDDVFSGRQKLIEE